MRSNVPVRNEIITRAKSEQMLGVARAPISYGCLAGISTAAGALASLSWPPASTDVML
jgi:hypothetical protein